MSRWSEREIARKLAERDELEPPPGLLEKIKSEIPPMIPAGTGVPEIDRRPSVPPRQRWLIAASLVAMIGAGVFAIHLQMEGQPPKFADRPPAGARWLERRQMPNPPAPPPATPAPERQAFQHQLREAPAAKPQLQKNEREALKALGYISPREEKKTERGAAEGRPDSVAGGEPAAPPMAVPPPPPPLMAAPPPPPAKAPVVQAAPLLDERRAEERDRVNVGGNESGQQIYDFDSFGEVPGSADRPQSAPAARAKAKTADSEIVWTSPAPLLVPLKPDAGTASYDVVRRAIAAGKLPDPGEIRVGEILNAFDTGTAPSIEGAPSPFAHGPQYRLLRFNTPGINPDRVTFNPALVVRCRQVGSGVSTLYEVELRSGVSRTDEAVATLGLGSGAKGVTLSELASSWDKASPGFRLAALAAELAEILKGSPVDSSALHRLSAEIGKLPKSAKATELRELVEKAGKIRG